jgi:hypothetical protein
MRMRFNLRWLLVPVLLLSLQLCRAETLSYNLGGVDVPESRVWDLNGGYQFNLTIITHDGREVPMDIAFNLIQDSTGRLNGITNDFQFMDVGDNGFFAISYRVIGQVTGTGGIARAKFSILFIGEGELAGIQNVTVSGVISVDATTDPDTGELVGTFGKLAKVTMNFSGLGSLNGLAEFSTPLPSGVDGTWTLTLNMAPLSRVVGTATAAVHSRTLGFDLTGKTKNGVSKIKLIGAGDVVNAQSGVGSTATILLFFDDSIVAKGKLMGQKVAFGFPPF